MTNLEREDAARHSSRRQIAEAAGLTHDQAGKCRKEMQALNPSEPA